MGRHNRPGGRTITPFKIDGGAQVPAVEIGPQGVYTLEASTTYYYICGGIDCPVQSFQLTGYTSAAVLTSVTLQDLVHMDGLVADHGVVVGEWMPETPTAYVATAGTGWTVGATGIVAAAGTGAGGALWHISDTGAPRTRFVVVVGGTGGSFRGSHGGKE